MSASKHRATLKPYLYLSQASHACATEQRIGTDCAPGTDLAFA